MRNSLVFSKSAKNTHLPPRMFKHALPIPDVRQSHISMDIMRPGQEWRFSPIENEEP